MNDKLRADLFCTMLMAGKVFTSSQIRKLMTDTETTSLITFHSSIDEFMKEETLSLHQKENWKKLQESQVYQRFDEYVSYVEARGIGSFDWYDEVYPEYMKQLPNMPLVLYYKGDLSLMHADHARVAIVGTRTPSFYGRKVTREFSKKLSLHEVVIVSGLAKGIDTVAHTSCLEAGGKTIAVMPCGLDQIYPDENRELAVQISKSGLLLSELAPGQKTVRQYFPARNRILSALSDCVLITEAGKNSGTLHTSNFAAAQGREVFVIPNTVYSETSEGNLLLLKDGATIVTEPEDILAYLAHVVFFRELDEIKETYQQKKLEKKIKEDPETLTEMEIRKILLEILSSSELSCDDIVKESGIPFQKVAMVLGKMELEGQIAQERSKYVLTIRY